MTGVLHCEVEGMYKNIKHEKNRSQENPVLANNS